MINRPNLLGGNHPSSHGPAWPVAQRPVIDEVSIRELEASGRVSTCWPARMLYALPVFLPLWAVVAITLGPRLGERSELLVTIPALWLGTGLGGYMLVADRAYTRAWRDSPSPERGRIPRRISQLAIGGIGVLFAVLVVGSTLAGRDGKWIPGVVWPVIMGLGAISMVASFAWSHARAPEVWRTWTSDAPNAVAARTAAAFGRSYAASLQGYYEPDASWTQDEDPNLVAWARALRSVWRNTWIAAAPVRYLVLLLGGPMARLASFRPGLAASVTALAGVLGGRVTSYDERTILDWLDAQGWGPAPHVPGVWLGVRWTIRGSYRGHPVAVSVVRRLGGSTAPTDRIDIFLRAGARAALGVGQPPVPVQMHGYGVQSTAWGFAFWRSTVTAEALSPALVASLLDWALASLPACPTPQKPWVHG
jgi:hypothetical protein